MNAVNKHWTYEEIEYLKNNYLTKSDEELAKDLGRSVGGIRGGRSVHQLIRPRKRVETKKTWRPRPSFQEVKQAFSDRGYVLLSDESEFKNLTTKIRYICPKHEDKGELKITYSHFSQGKGCYYCGREKTNAGRLSKITEQDNIDLCNKRSFEYIKTERDEANGEIYVYFYCIKHKELGMQRMTQSNMRRSLNGCKYCAGKDIPSWYIKAQIEEKYPYKVLSEYTGMNKPLDCFCLRHSKQFSKLAKYIYHDGTGCDECISENMSIHQRKAQEDVIKEISDACVDIEVVDASQYINYESYIPLRCNRCGYEWSSPFHSAVVNKIMCPNCALKSKGEQKVLDTLKDLNVNYQTQYRISDCKYKRTLPFDNSVLNENGELIGLIEYQGEQHYKLTRYPNSEERFIQVKERDRIKHDYCQEHNIPLLIILYYEYDNVKELVTEFVNRII